MSNVEKFPLAARTLSEYDALLAAAPAALDVIPGAVYMCDHEGWIVRFNSEAAELWGRTPAVEEPKDRFCGSYRLFTWTVLPFRMTTAPWRRRSRPAQRPEMLK